MESIISAFLATGYSGNGSGNGYGYGFGSGNGFGSGSGNGSGYGFGTGYGFGFGDGSGFGFGDGSGNGSGDGSGFGSGDGSGNSYSYGNGDGIKSFNKSAVHIIDDTQTIIESVRGNVAKGFILQSDLTLIPCFIVKQDNMFAHGKTVREAYAALQDKLFQEYPVETRIEKFKEAFPEFDRKYPAKVFFDWHYKLTSSCGMGRESFCRDRGIDVERDEYTVYEFIKLTENSYGSEIIRKLDATPETEVEE